MGKFWGKKKKKIWFFLVENSTNFPFFFLFFWVEKSAKFSDITKLELKKKPCMISIPTLVSTIKAPHKIITIILVIIVISIILMSHSGIVSKIMFYIQFSKQINAMELFYFYYYELKLKSSLVS